MKSGCLAVFLWILAPLLLVGGVVAQYFGFERIREMRQMERVSHVSAAHVVPGEVSMRGAAEQAERERMKGRYSGNPCFYQQYVKERKVEDSDGDTRWVTVESGSQGIPFFLNDGTGRVLVRADELGDCEPDLDRDYKQEIGNFRWSEWRVDPGEEVFAFAMAGKVNGELFEIRFDQPGSYEPILSDDDALTERSYKGAFGIMLSLGSVVAYAMGIMFFCFLFKVHRILVFISIVSLANMGTLTVCGFVMIWMDLTDGYERLDSHEAAAREEVKALLGGDFDWKTLAVETEKLREKERRRALGIREDFVSSVERTNAIRERFPESWLSPLFGVKARPSALAEGETAPSEAAIAVTPIPWWFSWGGLLPALFPALFGTWYGFRRVKIKRYVENVPTSLSTGLAYGPAEIKGKLELADETHLTGPLTKEPCVYYRYLVQETRGSGKRRRTVTITDESKSMPFLCRDAEGVVPVEPTGAEITASHKKTSFRGRRTYNEWNLAPGEDLYLLGSAEVDPETGDRLRLSDGDDDFPFLLSHESETEVMLRQSRKGLFRIGSALAAIVFLGLLLFGAIGSFAASDFLFAALVAPAFLVCSALVLMFNDLVFLRNRVRRAWANIEVSLKKRADLIPALEKVAKAYLAHERETMEAIAKLRTSVEDKAGFSPSEVDAAMREEVEVTNRLFALLEDNPNLKGDAVMRNLMDRLTRMENEVALMRAGYNDGVERYHEAKKRIPEVYLARAFRFEDAEYLQVDLRVRAAPQVNLTPAEDSSAAEA